MTPPAAPSIRDAVLWVNHPQTMLERLCGMAVLERQLFTLSQAGIRRVWIAAHRPGEADRLRMPEALEVHWVPREADAPVECRPPYVGVSGDHVLRSAALRELLAERVDGHVSFHDAERRSVIQVVPSRGERVLQVERRALPTGACALVGASPDGGPAADWLLEGARKSHDGLMARLFDRRISLAATRWLLRTPIRPNHMTVLSTLIGTAGALLFAKASHPWAIAGALLVWLHSVLDGCDGELARLRFQESRFGGVLDFWGDNVVHVVLFAALGWGDYKRGRGPLSLALGAVAAAASLASAILTFRLAARRARESSPLFDGLGLEPAPSAGARLLQRVEDILAQRDFIYLLLLATVLRQKHLFLLSGAIGAPIFFLILLYLTGRSRGAPVALPSAARGTP